jgi:MYXO-CTERM domain-containing protein
MKNFVRSGSVLLAFLCAMTVARRAAAAVVWMAGFESNKSGDVCASTAASAEFIPGAIVVNNGRIDAQVLGEQVYSGKLACKVTVHPDDIYGMYVQDRVDVKHMSTLTGEGKDMYLSGHYYLLEDAKTRNEFGMFETTDSKNWVDIWVEPKTGGGTSIKLGIESDGAKLGSVPVWSGDLSPATWHQIAIHIHWSQDATKGSVDFWLDGKQVVSGFKHKTKPNQNDLYYLTGLHRVLMQPYTESIYFDDFIEADTQDDIKIAAPSTTPDAGVIPDAGGGGASGGSGGKGGVGGQDAGAGTAGAIGAGGGAGSSSPAGGTGGGPTITGAGGASGMGGTGAAGVNPNGAAGTTPATPSNGRSSGSGCSIESPEPVRGWWLVVGALVAVWMRRRRDCRRR